MTDSKTPLVGVIMGSNTDFPKVKCIGPLLDMLNIPYEMKVVSAHRTPDWMCQYAKSAKRRGLKVIIACAGGAAHLPGMTASMTPLPVLGVPVVSSSSTLNDQAALLSMSQMPPGVPVATFAAGSDAGPKNAALHAARILALIDEDIAARLDDWIKKQTDSVAETPSEPAT